MTAIEQLNMWLIYQRHWTEHKPSVTISVKKGDGYLYRRLFGKTLMR